MSTIKEFGEDRYARLIVEESIRDSDGDPDVLYQTLKEEFPYEGIEDILETCVLLVDQGRIDAAVDYMDDIFGESEEEEYEDE